MPQMVLGAGGNRSRKPDTGAKKLSFGELGVRSVLLFHYVRLSQVVARSWKVLVTQAPVGTPFCFNMCILFLVLSM